ncbi:NERD domain-containing protein [Streptomyces sp. NPDC056987]|uniref:NERD domain-containing protein n=1 Tax=Streptomyces sp. NPDC056987 TaxID=3345988 RepID=UPI00362D6820
MTTYPHRIQDAGASARRRAAELRHAELALQHRRAAWRLPAAALGGYLLTTTVDTVLPAEAAGLSLVLGLLVPLYTARRLYEPGRDVQNWRLGAEGELQTAKILHPATRSGWIFLHDRAIPGSRANLDTLALLPDGLGALYIDSKNTRSRGHARLHRGTLYVGRRSLAKEVSTVIWEAGQASKALCVPVCPVIALHGAQVPRSGLRTPDGVLVVAAPRLHHILRRISHQRMPESALLLASRAESALPPYLRSRPTR